MFNLTVDTLTAAAAMFTSKRLTVSMGSPRTDGKRIWLPGIKPGLSPQALEILRGYFLHEAGHIVYGSFNAALAQTPAGLPAGGLHSMYNAIEDTRIESRLVQDYVGALSPIRAINEDNLTRNNEAAPELGTFMSACHAVLWRIQGRWDRATYCDAGKQLLRDTPGVMPLIDEWAAILTTDHVQTARASGRLAEEICRLIDQKVSASPDDKSDVGMPNYASPDVGDGDGDGDDDGDDGGEGTATPPDAPADTPNDTPNDGTTGGPADDGGDQPGGQYGSMLDELIADPKRPMFVPGDVFDESASVQVENDTWDAAECVNAASSIKNRPMCSESKMATRYPKIHSDAMRILQRLRKTLAANDVVSWTQPRDSGHRIDRRRLAGVTAGVSTRAFNRRRVDEGTKSMVSIALDMSSSMSKIGMRAASVAYMVADACESSRVPCGIATFNTTTYVSKSPGQPVTPGSAFDCEPRGYTDMLPAIVQHGIWAAQHPTRQPVLFIVSDGCTDKSRLCASTVAAMAKAGHRVYGIAIGDMDETVRDAITRDGMGVVQLPVRTTSDQLCEAFSAGLASI